MATSAQQRKITGQISDGDTEEPMSMTTVQLLKADSTYIAGTTSKDNGSFALTAPNNGKFILKMSSVGYSTLYKNIEINTNALFLSERKLRISKRSVQHLVVNAIKNAKLSDKYTVHKLRHTAATMLYRAGVDIRTLQELLGHTSIATTQLYPHIDNNDIKKAVKLNPLNNIN